MLVLSVVSLFFFFNDTATTEIYTLSLHDALPISRPLLAETGLVPVTVLGWDQPAWADPDALADRKSTRLNSSHQIISYAVFCLKKKKAMPSTPHTLTSPPRPRPRARQPPLSSGPT